MVCLSELASGVVDIECAAPFRQDGEVWISVHLFVDEAVDTALGRVEEMLCSAVESGDVSAFFFIHYWEGGPHLRVRCRGRPPGVLRTEAQLLGLARSHGTRSLEFSGITAAVTQPYVRELVRYGGERCIGLCEAHFMVSSVVALELARLRVAATTAAVDQFLLGRALFCLIMATRFAFSSITNGMNFLRVYHINWLTPRSDQNDRTHSRQVMERMRRAMETQYRAHASARLTAAVRACWAEPMAFAQTLERPMSLWCTLTRKLIDTAQERCISWDTIDGVRLLSGLIHMNNNRFRVGNRDESYPAFVAGSILEEVGA